MKNLVANLYNPHEQTKEELIKNFVVRHKIFKKLFGAIKRADMRYPEQHFLIEGQRGMGKTTLLLRLSYEIENDNDLNTWLIPVVLKEEAYYGITRLFKLWETIAQMLADRETAFTDLPAQMENAYDENSDYERIFFDLLSKALEKTGQKIILFIDNVGEMFKNFNDMESHRLREILMTCAQLRIVGATAVTLEASFRYEHAFYEFFKKATLAGLDKAETHNLLLQLAEVNQSENAIQNIIETQPGRVESLRILTGGVIRTVVILFDIFVDNQNGNAISDLDGILDRVTPLYKHRMDDLAPLQRDVVHTIALNWDKIHPDDIAHKARLKKEEVSTRLSELEKVFIVQRAATDNQTPLYYLSERFFNIWYLMRLAPKGSQTKVIWLVRFLESWYSKEELVQRAKRQIEVLSQGDYYPKAAFIFTEALAGTAKLDMETEHELKSVTRKFLAEKDKSLLAELSPSDKDLYEAGMEYYWNEKYEKAVKLFLQIKNENEEIYFRLAYSFDELKQYEKAEKYYLRAVEKEHVYAMYNLGNLYHNELKDYQKAEQYYLMAVEKEEVYAMNNLGILYHNELKDYQKAEQYYLMAVEKEDVDAMNSLGILYADDLKDYQKAEKYFLMAVEKEDVDAMTNLGNLYADDLKDYQKAEQYYLMAVEKEHVYAMRNLGILYADKLKDYQKAEKYYLRAVEKEDVRAMNNLGNLYHNELKDYQKAEQYYLMAVEKEDVGAMYNLGILYKNQLKDYQKAEQYYLMAVENEHVYAMINLGILYENQLKDYQKAEQYYLMAVENEHVGAMNSLAWFYFEQKMKKEEALRYGKEAVEKDEDLFNTHTLACIYLWHNQIKQAIQIAEKFMYDEGSYETAEDEDAVISYLMLLIAKHQYQHTATYFDAPDLNLKNRFKPLYYALLYFMGDQDYAKCPPELVEPVNDIIEKIKQMAVDYA